MGRSCAPVIPRALAASARSAALGFVVLLGACGGRPAAVPLGAATAATAAPASAPPSASGSSQPVPLPAVSLPPRITVASSRLAELRPREGAASCTSSLKASGDATQDLTSVVAACSKGSALAAVGAPLLGTQDGSTGPSELRVPVTAGRCYRLVAALAPSLGATSLLARDDAGAVIAEDLGSPPFQATPRTGVFCMRSAGAVTLVVGVGAGKGSFAVQLLGD